MEAKEIVAKEVARQVEFGYEPSWEDFVIAGQQAGIREVVEWVKENTVGLSTGDHKGDGGLLKRTIWEDEWQAKLKEWGI